MKLTHFSKALPAASAIAVAVCLAAPLTGFAKKPGNRPTCSVGTAAYPTIQSAVNDPECNSIGVPAGTFYENVNTLVRNVSIRGAGAGLTIVDGRSASAPVFALGDPTSSVTAEVALEGMTITGGTGPASGNNRNGGGISSFRTNLSVKDCVISGNSAWGNGGGLSFAFGTVTVKDSVIANNTAHGNSSSIATGGGGIRGAGSPPVLTVMDSVIANNLSLTKGGGILFVGSSPSVTGTLIVKDSVITGNTAVQGGGMYLRDTALTVKDSDVSGNSPENIYTYP
jgi:hypothetical protein